MFEVEFENDDDVVYFAFSQPYSYCQIISEVFDNEEKLKPSQQSLITNVPRKVIGQNKNPSSSTVIERSATIREKDNDKTPLVRTNTLI